MTETVASSLLGDSRAPHTASRGRQGDGQRDTVGPTHNHCQHQQLFCANDSSAAGQHTQQAKERRLEELLRSLVACSSSSSSMLFVEKANNSTTNTNIDNTNARAEAVVAEISILLPFVVLPSRREEGTCKDENKSKNNVLFPAPTGGKDSSSTLLYGTRCEGLGAELCALFGARRHENVGAKPDHGLVAIFPFHSEEAIRLLARLLLSVNSYYELAAEVAFSTHLRGLSMYTDRITSVEKEIIEIHREMMKGRCKKWPNIMNDAGEEWNRVREGNKKEAGAKGGLEGEVLRENEEVASSSFYRDGDTRQNRANTNTTQVHVEGSSSTSNQKTFPTRALQDSAICLIPKLIKQVTALFREAVVGCRLTRVSQVSYGVRSLKRTTSAAVGAGKEAVQVEGNGEDDALAERQRTAQIESAMSQVAKLTDELTKLVNKINEEQHERRRRRQRRTDVAHTSQQDGQEKGVETTQRASVRHLEVSGLANSALSSHACTDWGRTGEEERCDHQKGTATCREVTSHTCVRDGKCDENYQDNAIVECDGGYTNACETDDAENSNASQMDATTVTFITVPQSLTELRSDAMTAGPTQQGVPCSSCNYFYPLYRAVEQEGEEGCYLSLRPSFASQCVSCCPFTYSSTGGSLCEECFHLQEAVNALLCLAEDLVDGVLAGKKGGGGSRSVHVVVDFLHAVCADFNAYFSHLDDEDLRISAANWRERFLRSHAVLRENPRGHHPATESYRYMMNEASAASLNGILLLTEVMLFCEGSKNKGSRSSESGTPHFDTMIRSSSSQLLGELADAIRATRASFPHAMHHLAPLMPLVSRPRFTRFTSFDQKGVVDDDADNEADDGFGGDRQQQKQQKQQRLLASGTQEGTLSMGLRRGKALASIVYQMTTSAQHDAVAVDSGLIGGGTRVGMSDPTTLAALCKGANGIRCPSATVLKERAAGIFNSAFIRALPEWSACICNPNKYAHNHLHRHGHGHQEEGGNEGDDACATSGYLCVAERVVDNNNNDDTDYDDDGFEVLEDFEYVTPLHVPVSQRVSNAFRLFWDRPLLGIPIIVDTIDTTSPDPDVVERRIVGPPLHLPFTNSSSPTTASDATVNTAISTVAGVGDAASLGSSSGGALAPHAPHHHMCISYEEEEAEGRLLPPKGTAEDPNEYTTWKPFYYQKYKNDTDSPPGEKEEEKEGGERNSLPNFPTCGMPRLARWDPDLYGYSRLSAWRGKVEIDLRKWATNTDEGATEKGLCDDAEEKKGKKGSGRNDDGKSSFSSSFESHLQLHKLFNFSATGGSIDLCPFELPYSQPHSSPSVSSCANEIRLFSGAESAKSTSAHSPATASPPLPLPPPFPFAAAAVTAASAAPLPIVTVPRPLPIAWITYGRYYERLVRPMRLFIRRVLLADLTNNILKKKKRAKLGGLAGTKAKEKRKGNRKSGMALLPLRLALDEGNVEKRELSSSLLIATRSFPPLVAMPSTSVGTAGSSAVSEADAYAEGKRENTTGVETDTKSNGKDEERNHNTNNNNNNNNNEINKLTNPSVFISTRDSGLWYAAELAALLESCMYAGCYPYWSTVGEEGIFGALKLCAPSVVVFDTFVMDRVLKGLLVMATAEVKNEHNQGQNHYQHQQGEQGENEAENESSAAVLSRMLKLMDVYYLTRVLVMATNTQEATLYECCSTPPRVVHISRVTTSTDHHEKGKVPCDDKISLGQDVGVNAGGNTDPPSSSPHLSDLSAHELLGLLRTYSKGKEEVNEEKKDREEREAAERDEHRYCSSGGGLCDLEEEKDNKKAKGALDHSGTSGDITRLNGSKPSELWIEVLFVELFSSSRSLSPPPFVNHFERAHDVLERTLYDRCDTTNKKHDFSDDDKIQNTSLLPKYLDDSRIELVDLLLDFPRAKACNEAIRRERERSREGQEQKRTEIDGNNDTNNSNETENRNCNTVVTPSLRKHYNINIISRGSSAIKKCEERFTKRPQMLEKRIGAIFTSGTSGGKPKGVVIDERTWFFDFFGSPSLSMRKVNVNGKEGEGAKEGEREGGGTERYLSLIYPLERSDRHGASLSEHSPSWATDQYVVIGAFMNGSRVGFAPHSVPLLSPMLSACQGEPHKETEVSVKSVSVRTATAVCHRSTAVAGSPLSLSPSNIPSASSPLNPPSPSSSSPRPTSSFFDALCTFRPSPTLTCVPVLGQQLRVEYLRLLEWYKQREEEEEGLLALHRRGATIAIGGNTSVCCTLSPPLLTPAQRAVASTRAAAKASAVFYRFYLGGRIESLALGGASVPPLLQYFFRITTPIRVHDSYGSTEIGGILTSHRPAPGVTVRLVDRPELGYTTTDTPFPRGELAVRMPDNDSDSNSSGQLKNEEREGERDSTVSKLKDWLGDAATMESVKKRYVRLPSSTATSIATSAKQGTNAKDEINGGNNSSLYMLTGDIVMQVGTNTYVVVDRVSSVQKLASGKFFCAEAIEEAIRRYFLSIVASSQKRGDSQQKEHQKSQKMRPSSSVAVGAADDDSQQSDDRRKRSSTNSPSPFPFFESVLVAPSLDQENTVALLRFKIDSGDGNDWSFGEALRQENEEKEGGGEQQNKQEHSFAPHKKTNQSRALLSEKNLLRHVVKACTVGAGIAPDEVPIHVYLDNTLDRLAASPRQSPKPHMASCGVGKGDLVFSSWGPWSPVNKCLTPSGKVNRAVIVRDRLNVLMELDKKDKHTCTSFSDVDGREIDHQNKNGSELSSSSSSSRSSSLSSSSRYESNEQSLLDKGKGRGEPNLHITPKRLFFDSLLGLRDVSLQEVRGEKEQAEEEECEGGRTVGGRGGSRNPASPSMSTVSITLAQWILNEVLPGAFCVLPRFTLIPTKVRSVEAPLLIPPQQPSFVLLHSPSSSAPSFSYLTSYTFQALGANSLLLARAKSILTRMIGEAIQSKLSGVLAKSGRLISHNSFSGRSAELSFPPRFFETFTVPFLLSATPMSVANLFLAKLEPFIVQCKVRERAAALMTSNNKATLIATATTNGATSVDAPTSAQNCVMTFSSRSDGLVDDEKRAEAQTTEAVEENATKSSAKESKNKTNTKEEGTDGVALLNELISSSEAKRNDVESERSETNTEGNQENEDNSETKPVNANFFVTSTTASAVSTAELTTKKSPRERSSLLSSSVPRLTLFIQKSERGSSDLLTIDKTLPPGFKEMPVLVDDTDVSGPCVGHLYLWNTIERNVREIIDEGLARANSRLKRGRRSRHVLGGMRTDMNSKKKDPTSPPLPLRSTNSISRVVTVITGATGFLGVTLLRKVLLRLLQQDEEYGNGRNETKRTVEREEEEEDNEEYEEAACAPPLVLCLMRMASPPPPPRGEEQRDEEERRVGEESAQTKFIQREEQRLKSNLRKLLQDSLSFSPHLSTDKAAKGEEEDDTNAADDHQHRRCLSLLLSLFDRYVGVIPITDLGDVRFGYRSEEDVSLPSSSSRPSVPSRVEKKDNKEAMLFDVVPEEVEAEMKRERVFESSSDAEASSPYEKFVINRILASSYAHSGRAIKHQVHVHAQPLPIVIINSGAAVKHWGISEETVKSIGPANIIGAVNCGQLAVDLAVADSLLMLDLQQRTAPGSAATAVGKNTNAPNDEKPKHLGWTPSQCSPTAELRAGAGTVAALNMNRVALVHISTSSCDVGQVSFGSLPKSWLTDLHKDHLEREEEEQHYSSNGEKRAPFSAMQGNNNSPLRNIDDAYTVTKLLGEMGLAYLAERVATARSFPNSSISNNNNNSRSTCCRGRKDAISNLLSALLVPQFEEADLSSYLSSSSFSLGIVRAPMLSWDTETNFNNKNDWISQLLDTCRLLRIVPLVPPLMKHCGSIGFSPVDHFALLVLRGADEQLLCRSDVISRLSWRRTILCSNTATATTETVAVPSSFEEKRVVESEPTTAKTTTIKTTPTASSAPPIQPQPKIMPPSLPPTPSDFESVYSQHPTAMAIKACGTLEDMRDERVDRGFGFVGFSVFQEVSEDGKEKFGDCHGGLRNTPTNSDMYESRGRQHRFPSIAHLLICFTSTQEQRSKLSRYLMDCRRQRREEREATEAAAKENAAAGGGGEEESKDATTTNSTTVEFGSAKGSDGVGAHVTPMFTHPTALYLPPLSSLDFFRSSFNPPPYFFMSKVLAVLVDEENKLHRNAMMRDQKEEYEKQKENGKETKEPQKENENDETLFALSLSFCRSFQDSCAYSNYFTIVPSHSFAFALGTMLAELEEEEEERTAVAAAAAGRRAVTSFHQHLDHTTVKRKGAGDQSGDSFSPSSSSSLPILPSLPPSQPLTLTPYHLHHPRHFKFPLAPPPSAGALSSMFSSSTAPSQSKSSRVTAAEMNRRRAAVKELAEAIVSTEGLFGLREGSTMAFPQANSDMCERDGSVLPNAQAQCGGGHDASGGGYAARVTYVEGVGQLGESLVESTDRKLWEPPLRKWIVATYMH